MNLTDDLIYRVQRFLRCEVTDTDYLFYYMTNHRCMVYGANSPQLYCVAVHRAILSACEVFPHGLEFLGNCDLATFRRVVEGYTDSTFNVGKTKFEEVSNYWLQKMQSYAMRRTKEQLGHTGEGTTAPTGAALEKKRRAGEEAVEQICANEEFGAFYRKFRDSPFSMHDVIEGGDDWFLDHGSKHRRETTRGREMKLSDKIFDAAVRRSCKFLMYDSIHRGWNVVYLLDDLDLSKVAYHVDPGTPVPDWARIEEGGAKGKVPVCTSEVRECFRNWDFLGYWLRFFRGFEPCDPPWAPSHPQVRSWATYANHRATKLIEYDSDPSRQRRPLEDFHRGQFEECQRCFGASDWNGAIAAYHNGRPSLYTKPDYVIQVSSERERL
jgi:hypothetical protein